MERLNIVEDDITNHKMGIDRIHKIDRIDNNNNMKKNMDGIGMNKNDNKTDNNKNNNNQNNNKNNKNNSMLKRNNDQFPQVPSSLATDINNRKHNNHLKQMYEMNGNDIDSSGESQDSKQSPSPPKSISSKSLPLNLHNKSYTYVKQRLGKMSRGSKESVIVSTTQNNSNNSNNIKNDHTKTGGGGGGKNKKSSLKIDIRLTEQLIIAKETHRMRRVKGSPMSPFNAKVWCFGCLFLFFF